jgi:hypothetical protein
MSLIVEIFRVADFVVFPQNRSYSGRPKSGIHLYHIIAAPEAVKIYFKKKPIDFYSLGIKHASTEIQSHVL